MIKFFPLSKLVINFGSFGSLAHFEFESLLEVGTSVERCLGKKTVYYVFVPKPRTISASQHLSIIFIFLQDDDTKRTRGRQIMEW